MALELQLASEQDAPMPVGPEQLIAELNYTLEVLEHVAENMSRTSKFPYACRHRPHTYMYCTTVSIACSHVLCTVLFCAGTGTGTTTRRTSS